LQQTQPAIPTNPVRDVHNQIRVTPETQEGQPSQQQRFGGERRIA